MDRWLRSLWRVLLGVLLGVLAGGSGCQWHPGDPVGEEGGWGQQSRAVYYGKDDVREAQSHPDGKLRALSGGVAMLVKSSRVKEKEGKVTLSGDTWSTKTRKSKDYGKELCADQPFRDDLAPGSCTAFQLGPRLMGTAGHCIKKVSDLSPQDAQSWCSGKRIVFHFEKRADGSLRPLTSKDVYRCRRVLFHHYDVKPAGVDAALFELARDGPHPGLAADMQPGLQKGDGLAVIGYPHGMPLKIAAGAKVLDPHSTKLDYFKSTLDTSPGNSGSPVFSLKSYKVVGIHVRGARPHLVLDKDKQCFRMAGLPEEKVSGQSETYLKWAQLRSCQQDGDCRPTYTCEKKRCVLRTADLEVQEMSLSSSRGKVGEEITVYFSLANRGTAQLTRSFRVGIWWSRNDNICPGCTSSSGKDDTLLASKIVESLSRGTTLKEKLTFTVGDYFLDKQHIGVYVDDVRVTSELKLVPSKSGIFAELNEDNNSQHKEFALLTCQHVCTKEGETRCSQKKLEACKKQKSGCLDWEAIEECQSPQVCQGGKCVLTCQDACTTENKRTCQQKKVRECVRQSTGCLDWQEVETCQEDQLCKEGACTAKPPPPKKTEGDPCSENDDCQTGICKGDAPQRVCTRRCTSQDQCKGFIGYTHCSTEGLCWKKPPKPPDPPEKGSCQTSSDCPSGQECVEGQCATPQGCSCSASSPNAPPPPSPLFALLLLLPLFSRRRKPT